MDNWADEDYGETRMARRERQRNDTGGPSRERRFALTLAVASAIMLVLGVGIGFAIGRATAPKAPAPAPVTTATAAATIETAPPTTETVPATVAVVPTPPPPPVAKPPKTPTQISPDDGAVLTASTVTLKWSKVTDPTGITYSLEVQKSLGNGKWQTVGTFTGLKATSHTLSTYTVTRRWRVWAVNGAHKASAKSDWSTYKLKATTSTPSKTATKTP
jgi:hypothetical protein